MGRAVTKPVHITINGKRYRLRWVSYRRRVHGECDPPHVPGKEIWIDERLRGERKLEIIIHEMVHAAAWWLSEEFVSQVAKDIARALVRLGVQFRE